MRSYEDIAKEVERDFRLAPELGPALRSELVKNVSYRCPLFNGMPLRQWNPLWPTRTNKAVVKTHAITGRKFAIFNRVKDRIAQDLSANYIDLALAQQPSNFRKILPFNQIVKDMTDYHSLIMTAEVYTEIRHRFSSDITELRDHSILVTGKFGEIANTDLFVSRYLKKEDLNYFIKVSEDAKLYSAGVNVNVSYNQFDQQIEFEYTYGIRTEELEISSYWVMV